MKAIFSMKIDDCVDCPVSEKHAICNCDSFENEIGVYCGRAEHTKKPLETEIEPL